MATTAFTAASPRASAIAWKPTWKAGDEDKGWFWRMTSCIDIHFSLYHRGFALIYNYAVFNQCFLVVHAMKKALIRQSGDMTLP